MLTQFSRAELLLGKEDIKVCPPGTRHKCTEGRDVPGSAAFASSVAGLIIAGEVVKDLCNIKAE